ncbi:hypothetical protein [Streptomyces sp. AJS327]|uniref:hypothetical protein n=1 Tax=Streptomyces sp. AJS327 TaxID=2545265 RepID=UPI0015DFCA2E|nr:hypothetical protein [Streptomyces sp. AJS327]
MVAARFKMGHHLRILGTSKVTRQKWGKFSMVTTDGVAQKPDGDGFEEMGKMQIHPRQ